MSSFKNTLRFLLRTLVILLARRNQGVRGTAVRPPLPSDFGKFDVLQDEANNGNAGNS